MSSPIFALYAIGLFLAMILLTYGMAVRILLRVRFKNADCRLCEPHDIPSHLLGLFQAYESQLTDLGFTLASFLSG